MRTQRRPTVYQMPVARARRQSPTQQTRRSQIARAKSSQPARSEETAESYEVLIELKDSAKELGSIRERQKYFDWADYLLPFKSHGIGLGRLNLANIIAGAVGATIALLTVGFPMAVIDAVMAGGIGFMILQTVIGWSRGSTEHSVSIGDKLKELRKDIGRKHALFGLSRDGLRHVQYIGENIQKLSATVPDVERNLSSLEEECRVVNSYLIRQGTDGFIAQPLASAMTEALETKVNARRIVDEANAILEKTAKDVEEAMKLGDSADVALRLIAEVVDKSVSEFERLSRRSNSIGSLTVSLRRTMPATT